MSVTRDDGSRVKIWLMKVIGPAFVEMFVEQLQ